MAGLGLSGLQAIGMQYGAQQRIDGANDKIYDLTTKAGFGNNRQLIETARAEKFAALDRVKGNIDYEVGKHLDERNRRGPGKTLNTMA